MDERNPTASASLGAWFPVDNAGNLYCAGRMFGWARTLRLSFVLNEPVQPEVLQQALNDICPRFPTICAAVKSGLFWNYFERMPQAPTVLQETDYPGRPINTVATRQPNFRVLYYQNRVALEVFHGITDGGGAIRFLTSLVARYYELQGEVMEDAAHALRAGEEPTAEETEDPYLRHSLPCFCPKNFEKLDAFRFEQKRRKRKDPYMRVTHGVMRVEALKQAAANASLSLTEYLAAAMIHTVIQTSPAPIDRPVIVSIPIDLRRRFDSRSVRNFAYMTPVSFHPHARRDVTFEDICAEIAGSIQKSATPKFLRDQISANVAAQRSGKLGILPYPCKHQFLLNTYRKNQESFTLFLSNIGEIRAPAALLGHINRAEFVLGETPFNPFGVGVVSAGGLITVSFNDNRDDMAMPRFFFRFLASQDIPVHVESNRK